MRKGLLLPWGLSNRLRERGHPRLPCPPQSWRSGVARRRSTPAPCTLTSGLGPRGSGWGLTLSRVPVGPVPWPPGPGSLLHQEQPWHGEHGCESGACDPPALCTPWQPQFSPRPPTQHCPPSTPHSHILTLTCPTHHWPQHGPVTDLPPRDSKCEPVPPAPGHQPLSRRTQAF